MRRSVRASVLFLVCIAGCTSIKRWCYEGGDRDSWQHPERVIAALGIEPGQRVADLGSGGGYFTFRLAEAVGPRGQVYASDVDSAMNADLENRARERGVDNIAMILAGYDDPQLPEPPVHLIFTSNTYHHLENRTAYFAGARRYLRAGGRVAIIDYSDAHWFPRFFKHSTPSEVIQREMEAAGYRLEQKHDFLPRQHFLVFSIP